MYERTKDYGRSQFAEMLVEQEQIIAELKKYCCKRNDCSGRIKENQKKTATEILEELKEWLKEKIDLASQICLENISQDTYDKVISYNLALNTKQNIEQVLNKIEELKKESDENELLWIN